jgi:6-phosphogluconolactonase
MASFSFLIAALVNGPTGGIYEFEYSGTATQTDFHSVPEVNYIIYSPNHQIAYCTRETEGYPIGSIVSYQVTSTGLTPLNSVATGANGPCHISVNPEATFLFAANYGGNGNPALVQIPLNPDGSLEAPTKIIRPSGTPGPVADRQECGHVHCACVTPDGKWLIVVDLGLDRITSYPLDARAGIDEARATTTSVAPGSGPRHILFEPDGTIAYLVSELGNTLTVFQFNEGVFTVLKTMSTLAPAFTGSSFAAAVRFTPDRKALLVSNRGMDSVAIYAIDNKGGVEVKGFVESLGKGPRDLGFIDGTNVLVVANMASDNIALFEYDEKTYSLKPIDGERSIAVPQPLCVL